MHDERDADWRHEFEPSGFAGGRTLSYLGLLVDEVARASCDLLTITMSYTELALQELEASSPVRPWIEEIRSAAERNEGSTKRLIAAARRPTARPALMTPQVAVRRAEARLRGRLGPNHALTFENASNALIHADADLLGLALELLVDNAVEATPRGGAICVRLARSSQDDARSVLPTAIAPGPYVALRVEDSGPGIPSERMTRVFEPFYGSKHDARHAGLGLSICEAIARMHGGALHIAHSQGGCAIELLLPCVGEETFRPDQEAVDGPSNRDTVLLVEDEFVIRKLGKQVLEKAGFEVLTASGGREAIDLSRAHEGPIDLLVTDVVMPKLSGRELAEVLGRERAHLAVLFVSGYARSSFHAPGESVDSLDLLPKPFRPDDLVTRARSAIQRMRHVTEARIGTSA